MRRLIDQLLVMQKDREIEDGVACLRLKAGSHKARRMSERMRERVDFARA